MTKIGLYIIHNPELKERESAMKNMVDTLKIEANLVWSKPVNSLTEEDNKRFTNNVTATQRSLVLNHEYALQDALQKNYDYVIVLEDDAYCIKPDLLNLLIGDLSNRQLPNFHSIYLGCGCLPNIYNHIQFQGNYVLINVPESRCTEAMLYSMEGIKFNLLRFMNTIDHPLDFHFNDFYRSQPGYVNFHMHPHPVIQYGYKTTIVQKNAEKNE